MRAIRLMAQDRYAFSHYSNSADIENAKENPPWSIGLVSVVSYQHEFPVTWRFAIEPAFKFELLDEDYDTQQDHLIVFTPGINTYFGYHLRLMINGEFIRAEGYSLFNDSEALVVLLCLDI